MCTYNIYCSRLLFDHFGHKDQERLPPALQFLPPTKKREPDFVLRLTHVETLLLLCTTRWGRDFLRENGVYEIVRATHENETVDKVSGKKATSHRIIIIGAYFYSTIKKY